MKKYDFKEELDIEFEIVSISNLYNQHKNLLVSSHRLSFFQILWFKKGAPEHIIDFKSIQVEPNTLLFVGKDQVQIFDRKGQFEAKAILFTDLFFCKTNADAKFLHSTILFNNLLGGSIITLDKQFSAFTGLLNQMEKEYENVREQNHSDILRHLLQCFLLLAERESNKQSLTKIKKSAGLDYIILFKDLLDKQFRQVKQVNEYAKQLNITSKRLSQVTKEILGESPKAVIDERVMLEAKRMLAHTNATVKEIGFDLGFDEPTNFGKYFKNHCDQTPVEFREKFGIL